MRDDAYESFASALDRPTFIRSRGWWFCSVEHMREIEGEPRLLYCAQPDCPVKVPAHVERCSAHRAVVSPIVIPSATVLEKELVDVALRALHAGVGAKRW
jgi:hypothetical protein